MYKSSCLIWNYSQLIFNIINTLSFSFILGHWHLTSKKWSWLGRVGQQEWFTLTFIFEILSLLSSSWKWQEKVVPWRTRHPRIYLLLSFSLSVSSDSSLSLFHFHRNNIINNHFHSHLGSDKSRWCLEGQDTQEILLLTVLLLMTKKMQKSLP